MRAVSDPSGRGRLPAPPSAELTVARERAADRAGFLHVVRYELVLRTEGGPPSPPFAYDVLDRRALDACVIAAHHLDEAGVRHVWLLSSVRPPLALRRDEPRQAVLWELAAGLIEPGESPTDAAARELAEELGFHVDASRLAPLGPPSAPAPAFIGELHHFFHVEVDPAARRAPRGDGSALEAAGRVVSVPLAHALEAARTGDVRDAKTELALRRLADHLGSESTGR